MRGGSAAAAQDQEEKGSAAAAAAATAALVARLEEAAARSMQSRPRRLKRVRSASSCDGVAPMDWTPYDLTAEEPVGKRVRSMDWTAGGLQFMPKQLDEGLSYAVQSSLAIARESQDVDMEDASTVFDDEPEAAASSSSAAATVGDGLQQYVVVIDTNFWLAHLRWIADLVDEVESAQHPISVVIPWVVVAELDGLKNSTSVDVAAAESSGLGDSRVSALAREATRFVLSRLRDKSPAFRGQRSSEIFASTEEQKATLLEGNDNRILDCALYFAHEQQRKVAVLSNDKNLLVKCLVHELTALSFSDLDNTLHADEPWVFIQGLLGARL